MKVAFYIFLVFCSAVTTAMAQDRQIREKTQIIEGTVTDFFGVPWENATIRLKQLGTVFKPGASEKSVKIEKETKTDRDGKYKFTELPEDSYEITLLRIGNLGTIEESKQSGVIFDGETYRIDFGVQIGTISGCQYFVTGIVKDENDKPIESAKVSLLNAFNQRRVQFSTTDSDGFYRIQVCNPGQYVVFANTPKYEVKTATVSFDSSKDFLKQIDFNLTSLSSKRINWRK